MKKILDVGCGKYKFQEENAKVIGLDIKKFKGVDIVWNLEKTPLPFKNNEFDEVIANHVLEHIHNLEPLIKELWRITKQRGKIKIECPYFASSLAHSSMDHVRFFAYTTFNIYDRNHFNHKYVEPVEFKVKAKYKWSAHPKLKFLDPFISFIINNFPRSYQRFFCFIVPCEIIKYELKVVK